MDSSKIPTWQNGYQSCLGQHLLPSRFFKDIYMHAQMQTKMCVTKCWALNLHKMQEEKKWVLHDRATSAISTNTAIVPCSGCSYHSSPPGKKFQWTPDTQAGLLPQRSLCLNPPQVTRSILANLDISMEPFHHIFFPSSNHFPKPFGNPKKTLHR